MPSRLTTYDQYKTRAPDDDQPYPEEEPVTDKKNSEFPHINAVDGEAYDELMVKYMAVEKALRGIIEIGKRDMTNPKYDGYFDEARRALDLPF